MVFYWHFSFEVAHQVLKCKQKHLRLAFHLISRWRSWQTLDSMQGFFNFLGTTRPFGSKCTGFDAAEEASVWILSWSFVLLILSWASFNSWTMGSLPERKRKWEKCTVDYFITVLMLLKTTDNLMTWENCLNCFVLY